MSDDSDADNILREREERRALERSRIEEARKARRSELSRPPLLDQEGASTVENPGADGVPRVVIEAYGTGAGDAATASGPPRKIGGLVVPPSVAEFLKTDPAERFDIQRLNALHLPGAVDAARSDPALLATIGRRAEELMLRVKQEIDDPLSAGAFLRDQARHWYRESMLDAAWATNMTERWGGLFADSRVSGGRLQPWINRRLWVLREHAIRSGSFTAKLRRGIARDRTAENALGRTAHQQIVAEVAQAILDDLAAHPRDPDAPLPLVRLSELAVRREVPTINDALAALFNAPETGPFIVLHPNRYPDCDELVLRPPIAGASGAALAYSLGAGRPAKRVSAHGGLVASGEPGRVGGASSDVTDDAEIDLTTVWQAEAIEPAVWRRLIEERRRERKRLDPPPKDCRSRPAYSALRELLMEDGEARKAFVSVRWRGRPAGLPLLAALLQKGSLAPEVATDHEYLEAELSELVQGDPQWHPEDGRWTIRGWTIVREGSHHDGFRFRAQAST